MLHHRVRSGAPKGRGDHGLGSEMRASFLLTAECDCSSRTIEQELMSLVDGFLDLSH